MIDINFDKFNTNSTEGKLLLMSIAILTGLNDDDPRKFRNMTPNDVFLEIRNLANRVYHEEEWKSYQILIDRSKKIDSIYEN